MLGYVRPLMERLEPEEQERFRALYCGLCRCLSDRYGFKSSMLLSYDFVLLAMLLLPPEEVPKAPRRCICHPGGRDCFRAEAMEAAADLTVILSWWKLRDDRADKGAVRGIPAGAMSGILNGAYRSAAALQPEFDCAVRASLEALDQLEQDRCASMDRTADTFAGLLASAAGSVEGESRRRVLEQVLYHTGRWIYLVDALDDLKKDWKDGAYNPLLHRFSPVEGALSAEDLAYLRNSLALSLHLACSALELEEFGPWTSLLRNIFYFGLPAVEELVATGRWDRKHRRNMKETNP